MKKVILSALMLIGLTLSVQAQEISKNAIGLRLGDNDGFGTEVSYQRGLSKNNRVEVDLGWTSKSDYDRFKLVGLYQWVWNIDQGFNWYAGAGAGIGRWSYDYKYYGGRIKDDGIYGVIAGDVGIEYLFDFPLQLSIDVRPEFGINNNKDYSDNLNFDFAISARYRF